MPYEPPLTLTSEILGMCSEIAEMVGSLGSLSNLQKNPTLHRELRIKTIHSSLAIEQNTLNMEQVTAIMDGKRVLGPVDEIREVENAARAYDLLPELDPFRVDDLLRAHGVMMEDLRSDADMFRAGDVGVFDGEKLIHAGTPAAYVPSVVADLFSWLSGTNLHPLVASCVFHYEFEFIHPFSDGNGRTGRLWHTLILSRWRPVLAWLPIESVIRERQAAYYACLNAANNQGESTVFVAFMLQVIRDALAPYVSSENRDDSGERILALCIDDPTITVARIAEQLGMPKRTVERRIAKLRATGRIERRGGTRGGTWKVTG